MAFFGRVLICFITLAVMGVSGFAAPPNVELQLERGGTGYLTKIPVKDPDRPGGKKSGKRSGKRSGKTSGRRLADRALEAIDVQSADATGPSAKKADKLATLTKK
mmetsp:Transcript_59658/g.98974  ORF Transcript_59658/g.98974 Transcript_59658/m.98974 type:complete len:105 (+) Transcript_59658:40-354(+)